MESSESRSSLIRAACETGAWLDAELRAQPPPPPPPAPVTTIDLSHQRLTISSLQLLPPTLTCIDISRCGLDSVAPLRRLPRLELLNVSYNRLVSLDDVRPCAALKVLYARSNRVADVGGAAGLSVLQSLDLECNAIASLDALAPLWGLSALTELRLRGNLLPIAAYTRLCGSRLPGLRSLDGAEIGAGGDGTHGQDATTKADAGGAARAAAAGSAGSADGDGGGGSAAAGAAGEDEDEEAEAAARAARLLEGAVTRWREVSATTPPGATPGADSGGGAYVACAADADAATAPLTLRAPLSPAVQAVRSSAPLRGSPAEDAAEAAAAAAAAAIEANESVRSKVSRLETELSTAESSRQREVSACARAGAAQVRRPRTAVDRARSSHPPLGRSAAPPPPCSSQPALLASWRHGVM